MNNIFVAIVYKCSIILTSYLISQIHLNGEDGIIPL